MKNLIASLILTTAAATTTAQAADFYVNQAIQALAPAAFATQPEGVARLHELELGAAADRERLVAAIRADVELAAAVAAWGALSIDEQVPFLRRIFALEWRTLGIQEPGLEIGPGVTRGAAFFEFDLANPGPGKILLNTTALANEDDPYTSLLLLIHETRHAAQFQGDYLRAAFQAQGDLRGRLSFCDFTLLLNEYEAFRFANFVVGKLTDWRVDTLSMGTFASQFDATGQPRIDLEALSATVGPEGLLEAVNAAEVEQFELLYGDGAR